MDKPTITTEQRLRAALAGLVGADSREELEAMEAVMRFMPAPDADKAAMLNAIHVLLDTDGIPSAAPTAAPLPAGPEGLPARASGSAGSSNEEEEQP